MTTTLPARTRRQLRQTLKNLLLEPQPSPPEYQQWRNGLIRQRFWVGIGLTCLYISIAGIASYYEYFVDPERLLWALEVLKVPEAFTTLRQAFVIHKIVAVLSLLTVIFLWRRPFVRKHPALILLLLPWAIAFVPEIILGAVLEIPQKPSIIMFLAQAIIIPVYWRFHLLAQLLPIAFYFLVYPLLGLTHFGTQPIYSLGYTVELVLVCLICELGVHLFETTKQSEIEANLRLQCCIHSIAHDLRTPVMGSLLLLRSLQQHTPAQRPIELGATEMTALISGGERLLSIMDTLMIPQTGIGTAAELVLHPQEINIADVAKTILEDFREPFARRNIQVENKITGSVPKVYADTCQIGRVFSNLIDNAIRHNPLGTRIVLFAEPVFTSHPAVVRVVVSDNGRGIALSQQSSFEPYVRGTKNSYQPGLGLGLYICKQIVQAHSGQVGIGSGGGTAVWFTLPLAAQHGESQRWVRSLPLK